MCRSAGALIQIWKTRDGTELAVRAATWELNPKVSFASLAPEFKANSVLAWRNYGSVVDRDIAVALRDASAILEQINTVRDDPWDVIREVYQPWFRGVPGRRYFAHFDLSKNRDATGFALVHREKTGVVVVDVMVRIVAKPGQNIKYAALREQLVYPLLSRGFKIECITFDGWQSEDSRQILEERGIATDYCSADKSPAAYDTLLGLLTAGNLDYYSHPVFLMEIEELRLIDGMKYDHPKRFRNGLVGSKDVADAVACATLTAVQYEMENPQEPIGVIKVHATPAARFERSTF